MAANAKDGDFAKRHLTNPALLRLLGDVRGRRVLDVFAVVHPAFERLWPTWREHGEYRVRRYLAEYAPA
ncbi:MAG TPA: hypothetical protein VGD84_22650 [Pseudonocardiaceae bacterium]